MKIMQAHDFFEDDTRMDAFYVNSCGYFYDIRQTTGTERLQGRRDYQLICITEGRMQVQQAGEMRVLEKGAVLLFKPDEPQIYGCAREDTSAYFWVHFGGAAAKDILEKSGLYATGCCQTSAAEEGVHLIQKMIAIISRRPPLYQLKLLSQFTDLISRICCVEQSEQGKQLYAKLSPALTAMEQEIHKNYAAEEYAAMCSMSTHHFMHCFKAYTGRSPAQYRNRIAMDHAVYLLKHTALSVGEVGRMVGVEDPLYFSKKFKKYFGVCPAAYRKEK